MPRHSVRGNRPIRGHPQLPVPVDATTWGWVHLIIALGVLVIWALAAHGRDMRA
jgi:hypothetical protein